MKSCAPPANAITKQASLDTEGVPQAGLNLLDWPCAASSQTAYYFQGPAG